MCSVEARLRKRWVLGGGEYIKLHAQVHLCVHGLGCGFVICMPSHEVGRSHDSHKDMR